MEARWIAAVVPIIWARILRRDTDLGLELSKAFCQGLHLGIARSFDGVVAGRGLWCTRVNDVGYAGILGRSEIADVNHSRPIDPGVNVRVSRHRPKRADKNRRQSRAEKTCEHHDHLVDGGAAVLCR